MSLIENLGGKMAAGKPEIDITLKNVTCTFSVRCNLDLKKIALNGKFVALRRENRLTLKYRRPDSTAWIWSSGKVKMFGATSETDAEIGARRCARTLKKLGFDVEFTNYRIVKVLATCEMPFGIKVGEFAQAFPGLASYEPELHSWVSYKSEDIRAALKIFSTGSITITAPCVQYIQSAVEEIYAQVFQYKQPKKSVKWFDRVISNSFPFLKEREDDCKF